jgi:glycosyltransferase involved in cell wall biosynthesis
MSSLIDNAKLPQMNHGNFESNLIYQCSSFQVGGKGGAETYLTSLINYRLPNVSNVIIESLKNLDQKQFKLLHIHSPDLLVHLTGECPIVFTAHNHSSYCPSGTKYFSTQHRICERNISYLGCSWGKIVDGCGSRKPQRIINELQHSHEILKSLKTHKITAIANSNYVREQLVKNGVPLEQTVTLYCGISIPQTATAPLTLEKHKNQRILFVGRIVPDKGLEWLLKSLVHTDERIHLDIAGEGWDRPRLEILASKLGLNNRITWHGWCNSEKINTLYDECFAVIFPSVWPEPAGLVTLEAYARYRPVIASAVGGIPEHLQDRETGILIPSHDIKKLSDAITELSTNYQKCRRMGELGNALFMKKFTMDVHVKNLQIIYEESI